MQKQLQTDLRLVDRNGSSLYKSEKDEIVFIVDSERPQTYRFAQAYKN